MIQNPYSCSSAGDANAAGMASKFISLRIISSRLRGGWSSTAVDSYPSPRKWPRTQILSAWPFGWFGSPLSFAARSLAGSPNRSARWASALVNNCRRVSGVAARVSEGDWIVIVPQKRLLRHRIVNVNGIHPNTIRLRRDKYGGMETIDLARLKQLEEDNRRKDRIIARMALEVDAMKELVKTNGWGLRAREKP
jgi:putative transposase